MKSKAFRIDDDLSAAWDEWVDRRGLVQEKLFESLLIYAMGVPPDQITAMMEDRARWLAGEATPAQSAAGPTAEDLRVAAQAAKHTPEKRTGKKAG